MRIALDYQIFALQTYGGISRYFARLVQEFLSTGEQVRIFAPLHINAYLASLPSECIEGKYFDHFLPKMTPLFSFYNRVVSRGAIREWEPDLLHETYYARQALAPKKCPTVITVYDMINELFCHEFPLRDKTVDVKKISIARADHVICISENTKKDLMSFHGVPEDKISVILLGFDQFADRDAPSRVQLALNRPFLLYVGLRGGYKNFAGFLKAVASSPKLRSDFDVIAFGGGKLTSAELELIARLRFPTGQVQQVSGDDALLGCCYTRARAFVYPSLYEGFGIPPLEAMAHGCPVVSSNASSMPEVVGQAGEFFNPTSTDEMQHAIESVVYSDSRIAELKALGTARLAQFSWTKCAEQTRAVYRTLLQ